MGKSKVRGYLEAASTVAVLLAAIAVMVSLAAMYFKPTAGPQLRPGIEKGEPLAHLPGFNFGESERALLIVISTSCGYCDESIPFYRQLAEARQGGGRGVRLVAVLPESEMEVKRYMQQRQLDMAAVPAVDLKALKVAGTPILILVDGGGRVIDFWVGKLSQDTEQQLLKIVKA